MHQATLRVVVTLNHTNDIEFSVHRSRKSLQAVVRSAGVSPVHQDPLDVTPNLFLHGTTHRSGMFLTSVLS